ncbi:MAG TPA: phage holin family protein [Mycobacteriales bacterium]|nr:phage holin family protein [Mycobacteriales bacterium]
MLSSVDFLLRVVLNAVGLAVAVFLVDGIVVDADSTAGKVGTYLAVGLVVGVVNATIRPVVLVLSCPLTLLTLGLFSLVINALLFWLSATISDKVGIDFEVDGFWSAFWGAIVVSLVSWILSMVVRRS